MAAGPFWPLIFILWPLALQVTLVPNHCIDITIPTLTSRSDLADAKPEHQKKALRAAFDEAIQGSNSAQDACNTLGAKKTTKGKRSETKDIVFSLVEGSAAATIGATTQLTAQQVRLCWEALPI